MPQSRSVSAKSGRVFCCSGAISSEHDLGRVVPARRARRRSSCQVARVVEAAQMRGARVGQLVAPPDAARRACAGRRRATGRPAVRPGAASAVRRPRAPGRSPPARRSASPPGPGRDSAPGRAPRRRPAPRGLARNEVTRVAPVAAISSSRAAGKKHGVSDTVKPERHAGARGEPRQQRLVALGRPLSG